MNRRHMSKAQAFRGALSFATSTPEVADVVAGSNALTTLERIVGELSELAVAQDSTRSERKGMRALEHRLVQVLRLHHMRPVVSAARAAAETVPELAALSIPHDGANRQEIVATAKQMAQLAAPWTAMFVAAGLPEDFIARLEGAADAVAAQSSARRAAAARRQGATQGVSALTREGMRALDLLDALIMPAIEARGAELVTRWRETRRVGVATVRRGTTAQPADDGSMVEPAKLTIVTDHPDDDDRVQPLREHGDSCLRSA